MFILRDYIISVDNSSGLSCRHLISVWAIASHLRMDNRPRQVRRCYGIINAKAKFQSLSQQLSHPLKKRSASEISGFVRWVSPDIFRFDSIVPTVA